MPADKNQLANLIHFEVYVHRHLDWRPPLEWVGYPPYLVALRGEKPVATLACPPDPPQVSWIRLFAASSLLPVVEAWNLLWPEARRRLRELPGMSQVAAIPLQGWFQGVLERSGFRRSQTIVMLSWQRRQELTSTPVSGFTLRPMSLDDLGRVEAVDNAAFQGIWQNSKDSLEIAFRQSACATIAEADGRMVGYQISTATPMGGHLARLAVIPESQGHGIGAGLVANMLAQFERRGARTVTVNTQQDNRQSLHLYERIGFRRTGEEYPVYQIEV